MAIAHGNRIYVASSGVTLATTAVVVYIALRYSQHLRNELDDVRRLSDEASCALCYGIKSDSSTCEKCAISPSSESGTSGATVPKLGCELPASKESQIEKIIAKELTSYKQQVKNAMDSVRSSPNQVQRKIRDLTKRASLPVISCFASHNSETKNMNCDGKELARKDMPPQYLQKKAYRYRTMKFLVPGWYDVHFQADISGASVGEFFASLSIVDKENGKHKILTDEIDTEEALSRRRGYSQPMYSLSGHGVFEIHSHEQLELLIVGPSDADLTLGETSSHISALFLRTRD